jgi:dTDP-4-amino-4,6-dideoxygalactose transaminase
VGVPLLDLKAQYATQKDEINRAVLEVLESQHFILGPQVKELEEAIGRYVGAAFACGVSSGTDALLIALMAEGVGPGDEVITPPYSFFATAGCPVRLGATPVFVEIEPRSFNLDPARLEAAITPRTKAIIPVHLYGQSAELKPILEIAARRGVPVIEDGAQAIGTEYQGRRVGGFGAYGCFSFFPSKNLGGAGDGGMVVTQDPARAQKLEILRVHGGKPKYYHRVIGGNFRLDAIQAAVLNVKLRLLDEWTRRLPPPAHGGRLGGGSRRSGSGHPGNDRPQGRGAALGAAGRPPHLQPVRTAGGQARRAARLPQRAWHRQ